MAEDKEEGEKENEEGTKEEEQKKETPLEDDAKKHGFLILSREDSTMVGTTCFHSVHWGFLLFMIKIYHLCVRL